jgi:hypothetical protein
MYQRWHTAVLNGRCVSGRWAGKQGMLHARHCYAATAEQAIAEACAWLETMPANGETYICLSGLHYVVTDRTVD